MIYPGYVTAQVVYQPSADKFDRIPKRTTVRSYMPDQVALWCEPTDVTIARYETAWGFR